MEISRAIHLDIHFVHVEGRKKEGMKEIKKKSKIYFTVEISSCCIDTFLI